MIAGITAVFGINMTESVIKGIIASLVGTMGTTMAGRTIAANLFKLIPGAGTVIGGTINGSTAALLTTALGETYIKIMEMSVNGELNLENLETKQVHAMLKDILKKKKKK